jgi:hypothetical protein
MKISMVFQKIVTSALSANYVGSDWFDQYPNLRFATEIVNRNEIVSTTVERHGHSYKFSTPSISEIKLEALEDENGKEEQSEKLLLRFQNDFEGLDELTASDDSIPNKAASDIMPWLTKVYKTSRGFELGTFDSSLLAMTMKTQSSNWEAISFGYIKDVICMAHKFIQVLLGLVCPDRRVQDGLHSVLMDELFAKYREALNHVRFLLHVERYGTPATLNHYFNDNLQKRYAYISILRYKLLTDTNTLVAKRAFDAALKRKFSMTAVVARDQSVSMTSSRPDQCPISSMWSKRYTISSNPTTRSHVSASPTTSVCRRQTTTW